MDYVSEPSLGDEIRLRAYYRYVDRGRQDGYALDDWLTAEREIFEELDGRATDIQVEAPECV